MKILIQFEEHERKDAESEYWALRLHNATLTISGGTWDGRPSEFKLRGTFAGGAYYQEAPSTEQWQKEQAQLSSGQKLLENKS